MQKRTGHENAQKVLLLAIDSTNLSFLCENLKVLPNIRSVFDQGQVIGTKSSATLLSASGWPTFASGLLPGEHGHYFPLQWNPSSMRFMPMRGNTLFFEPFWTDLARRGVKTVVFDAMSVPVDPESPALQVVNWNTQCNFPAASNNKEVLQYIKKTFGKKPIGDEIAVKKSRRALERHRDRQIKSLRKKTDAILWLMQEFEWEFFLSSYYEGHRAGHNLWPIWEEFASDPPEHAMLDVYRELDTQFGRILAALDLSDTALVLFSMHGMAPGYAQDHFLEPVLSRVNALYLQASGDGVVRSGRRNIAWILRQTVPADLQRHIRERVGQRIQDWLVDRAFRGGKDWKHTPAFMVPGGGDVGFIRLNIAGRERDGCLPPLEEGGDRYVDFLCRHLRDLRVKQTNEPLIRDIIMAQEVFPGSRSHLLPDILLIWAPKAPATEIWSEELGSMTAHLKTGRGGNHTGESFAVLAGAIDPDNLPPLRHIVDYKNFVSGLLRPVPVVAAP